MPVRSTTLEFGYKLETTPQTAATLTGTDFGAQIFEPQITIDGDPELVDPVGNESRPLYTRKQMQTASVTWKQGIVRGAADGTAPSFYPALQACGFTLGTAANADVATLAAMPSNAASLTCEQYDGLQRTRAWGVRGTCEIAAEKPSSRIMFSFNGKGHGDVQDQSSWPSGITDDTVPSAIFESNTLTIGGFVPEVYKASFKTEGDPILLANGLLADGLIEPWLAKITAWLRLSVYQHTLATRDWISALRNAPATNNKYAIEWAIDMGGGLELAIAGLAALGKWPNRANQDNVGIFPLEFAFLRGTDITITQRTKV